MTLQNDERVLNKAVELHRTLVDEMKQQSSDGDFETQCFFNPLPAIVAKHGAERGGNIFGIEDHTENAVILLGSMGLNGVDQEAMGREKMMKWKDDLEAYTREIGGEFSYRYANYADGSQDVLAGYGEESVRKMREVSKKYDAEGIFQSRVPGGFKIPQMGEDARRELL